MPRREIRVWGINLKWIFLAITYPFMSWAIYQDLQNAGGPMSWYFFIPISLLSMGFGILFIIKVLDPMMRYMDNKIEKLLKIKQ